MSFSFQRRILSRLFPRFPHLILTVGLLGFTSAAFAIDITTYIPHTPGDQWSYVNNNGATMTSTVGSPVTLANGVSTIPIIRVDSETCGNCVSYITLDSNGYRGWEVYENSVYVNGYGNTSESATLNPAWQIAPQNVQIGSTYTSSGQATYVFTGIGSFPLSYSTSTQIVDTETVSNYNGTQSWSAVKVITTYTVSGSINGTAVNSTETTTGWLVEGLGTVQSISPNVTTGVEETWKLVSTNVIVPPSTYLLTVTESSGAFTVGGNVVSGPAGINCPVGACSASFASGGIVVLTATANTGYIFTGWSGGGCSGTGTCSIVMAAAESVTATFANAPATPDTGFWWNPNEAGRGYVIEQRGPNLFMAAFLYDPSGRSTWFGVGPGALSGSNFANTLTSYGGGQTLTGAYKSPTVTGIAGNISVSFSSATNATLTWPEGTISIQKLDFGPGGSAATQPVGTPQSGWWYAPTEGGRGFAIEIQGNSMYLAGYMYDTQGNPVWYLSVGNMTNTMLYQGEWQQYGNGQTLTGSYQAPSVINAAVGTVTLQFSSTTAATLTLPDGRQVQIARYPF